MTPIKPPLEEFKTNDKKKLNIKYKNPPFLSSLKRFEDNEETKYPPPGHYEVKNTLQANIINRIQKGYRGNFGTKDPRFNYSNAEVDLPGPGTYQNITMNDYSEL